MKNLLNIYRAGSVRRYHTALHLQQQDVASHSWGVLAILLYIEPWPSVALMKAAVYHDVGEVVTGDIPAPFKWDNPKLAKALAEAEAKAEERMGVSLTLLEHEKVLLKIADLGELVLRNVQELMLGNRYAAKIIQRGLGALDECYGRAGDAADEFIRELEKYTHEMEDN
jgi:5'-deoxynucleotidase YfbR-like HD superfamily hydrolase